MNRDFEFTEDFRKKFITREYGNYEKYEKNAVVEEIEKGEDDTGIDKFHKNIVNMNRRLNTVEGDI